MTSRRLQRITGLCLSLLVLLTLTPILAANDVKDPKKPRRAKTIEELLKFKQFPIAKKISEEELESRINPHLDLDKAWKIREESYGGTEEGKTKMLEQYQDYKPLTLDQAIDDVDFFIDLMTIASLDYERIGGEKAFKKFRKKVIKKLKERLNQTGQLYAIDLERAMAKHIRFIDNQHFWLGPTYNNPYENRIEYREYYGNYPEDGRWMCYKAHFMCQNLTFQREGNFYRCYQNGKIVDNKSLEEAGIDIVPTWNKKFKVLYRLHYFGRTAKNRPAKITFADRSTLESTWVFSEQVDFDMEALGYPPNEISMIKGVPYLNVTKNALEGYYEKSTGEAIRMGKEFKRYPYGIIDLRNNYGGYPDFLQHFLSGYCDVRSYYFQTSADHLTYDEGPGHRNNYRLLRGADEIFEKDGILIVLVNNNVHSAGEMSLDYLKHLSNTIIVGDASGGTLMTSAGLVYFLPNSGIAVSIPTNNRFWNPDYFQEGKGFEPDIWTMTDNIDLEALATYLKKITAASEDKK